MPWEYLAKMKAKILKNNKMEIKNQIFEYYYTVYLKEEKIKEAKELLEKNGYKVLNLRTYNK